MDSASEQVLWADGVSKAHPGGVHALDHVSLAVGRAETVVLLGESGAGKSTLLRCFNALERPDAGAVRVRGQDVREVDGVALRRSIGYIPQEGGLFPHWTVVRNVALVPDLLGWEPARTAEAVKGFLGLVGLDLATYGDRYPAALSGGERQRVAIARALCAEPSIVLLDEPFGALDAVTRRRLEEESASWMRSLGVTTLLVTHDVHSALRVGDRVGVMRRGRLLQLAPPAELRASPADPYVRELLEAS